MIDGVHTLSRESNSPDVLALASVRDDPNNNLSNYMARLATITYDVIPRRVTLYSAVFGLGHLDSDTEMEPDIEMTEVDPEMNTNQAVAPVSADTAKAATPEP
ncbi:hypothetical protein H4S04_003026, partial [Coemansia sp. S16]